MCLHYSTYLLYRLVPTSLITLKTCSDVQADPSTEGLVERWQLSAKPVQHHQQIKNSLHCILEGIPLDYRRLNFAFQKALELPMALIGHTPPLLAAYVWREKRGGWPEKEIVSGRYYRFWIQSSRYSIVLPPLPHCWPTVNITPGDGCDAQLATQMLAAHAWDSFPSYQWGMSHLCIQLHNRRWHILAIMPSHFSTMANGTVQVDFNQ